MAIAIGADEKKKLYFLGGLFGLILVVGAVLYIPRGGTEDTPATTSAPAPKAPGAPAAGGAASPALGAKTAGAPAASAGGTAAASLVSVGSFRPDPFAQFKKPQLPPIAQDQTGMRMRAQPMQYYAPEEPVILLPPDQAGVLPPGQDGTSSGSGGSGGGGLPPMDVGGAQKKEPVISKSAKITWPKIDIPREVAVPVVPRSTEGQGGAGGGGVPISSDKRLSGVVIGDSVRATLVMPDGTSRIVQPGDEIDGIRVLRIERVTEGGRSVTRVIIRENGEERAVVLKPADRGGAGRGPAPGGAGRGPAAAGR